MGLLVPPSGNSTISLGTDHDLLIEAGVVREGTTAVTGESVTGNEVDVFGTLFAQSYTILLVPGGFHDIHIHKTGKVVCLHGAAVFASGAGTVVTNDGIIVSSARGVLFTSDSGIMTLSNTGTISTTDEAIDRAGGTYTAEINNSGTITSDTDAIRGHSGDASFVAVDRVTNTGRIVGNILLGGGDDVYAGASGRLTGEVFADDGNDFVTGGIDANTFFGGAGNDTLSGNGGNDTLNGEAGLDIINGGLGRDLLSGGTENDRFVFSARTHSLVGVNSDRILDFDDPGMGNDTINLSALFGPKLQYIHAAAFTKLGQVRINDVAGPDVLVEANLVGSLAADFSIRLTATTLGSMNAGDFIL
jgi:Ca2+-binding RTX toxin-like protein